MTTLIIDADGPLFIAASAVQKSILWDDDLATSHADLDEGKDAFETALATYLKHTDPDARIILCFSCPSRRYFRHDILPSYKSHRKSAAPMLLRPMREWAAEAWESRTKPGLEADDVVGILATVGTYERPIIVSTDKDLDQIPGVHLNALDPAAGEYTITPAHAERQKWLQTLSGDHADGYSGVPGCGPVKAAKVLDAAAVIDGEDDYPGVVLDYYLKAGLTAEDLRVQHNVARILTAKTYDFKRKEPILWTPRTSTTPSPSAASATAPSRTTRRSRKT